MIDGAAERITGRVAQVMSIRDLVINRGSNHGVYDGLVFKVLDGDPYKVIDPETEEVLGEVARVKVLVKVVETSPLFCVARTYRSHRVNVGGGGLGGLSELNKVFQPPKYEYRTETLERSPDQRDVNPLQALVSKGDRVESLLPDEDDDEIASIAVWQ